MKSPIDPQYPKIRRLRPGAALLLGVALAIGCIVLLKPELDSREVAFGPVLIGGIILTLILIASTQRGGRGEESRLVLPNVSQTVSGRPQMSKTTRIMACLLAFAGLIIIVNGDHISSVRHHGIAFGTSPSENEILGVLSMLMLGAVFLVGVKVFLNPPN